MSKQNILGLVSPVIEYIESMNHPDIKSVKRVPAFAELEERKIQLVDGAVYVYPDGSSTDAQRAGGKDMRNSAGVSIAVCVKVNTVQGMPYYERAGEVFTDILIAMGGFIPHNPRYPNQQFYAPKEGAQDRDHGHVYMHGHFFLTTRYIYQTFLRSNP